MVFIPILPSKIVRYIQEIVIPPGCTFGYFSYDVARKSNRTCRKVIENNQKGRFGNPPLAVARRSHAYRMMPTRAIFTDHF